MRLIDADKLVNMLYDSEYTTLCPLDEVSGVIDACPTVDTAMVRCGECKKFIRDTGLTAGKDVGLCDGKMIGLVRLTDYCSFGELLCNGEKKD